MSHVAVVVKFERLGGRQRVALHRCPGLLGLAVQLERKLPPTEVSGRFVGAAHVLQELAVPSARDARRESSPLFNSRQYCHLAARNVGSGMDGR